MSSLIERNYINLISSSHDRFRWVNGNDVANCRCRLCGDSESSKIKARGYFYYVQKLDMFLYKCHKCGASMSFTRYIKLEFPHYSKEMRLEKFTYKHGTQPKEAPKQRVMPKLSKALPERKAVKRPSPTDGLLKLTKLDENHIAVKYVKDRKLPKSAYKDLYYVKNYAAWVKTWINVGERKYPADERLVMLMRDKNGKIFGAQGRTLSNHPLRYSTVKIDNDDNIKIFGLDSINEEEAIFVLEGAFDSFFIPNSVAICGGDVGQSVTGLPKDKLIVILDNEPRSEDTIRRMEKVINSGYRIVIWEGINSDYKDINDMIKLGGMKRIDVMKIIAGNVYSGTRAKVKLNMWKKR